MCPDDDAFEFRLLVIVFLSVRSHDIFLVYGVTDGVAR